MEKTLKKRIGELEDKVFPERKCEHNFEQSHDAFDSGSKRVAGYRTHPDIPPFSLMNRHQICKKCGIERIFKIDSFTGLELEKSAKK